jgi:tRNA pseudouridine32 synthase/23S rRNA pseudouridine746 synthase
MTAYPLERYVHPFPPSIAQAERPQQFTYPFCYQPHPLCIDAARLLQHRLESDSLWQRHQACYEKSEPVGKMFGVLVVDTPSGELGYLAAFSGKLADSNHHVGFVPPVYDTLDHDNIFVAESAQINALNQDIESYETSATFDSLKQQVEYATTDAEQAIGALQQQIRDQRAQRKQQRTVIDTTLTGAKRDSQLARLAQQSIDEKRLLAHTKQRYHNQIEEAQSALEQYQTRIAALKAERKQRSNALQHALFSNYRFLNAKQESRPLVELFTNTLTPTPPAGSGECAAPKLLQFAYQHQLKPLAMAEFWWGDSPKSAIRRHKTYYPSCNSKCLPILTHMLNGLDVEPNPLLNAPIVTRDIEVVYQDEAIIVINKPEEMLSVPGVHIHDSALTRLEAKLGPREEGPFVVHRLDMSTSGLLVFALTHRANKHLQKQFITRQVEKRYIAEVEGVIATSSGDITLPLAPDLDDKPRQLVCHRQGKPAQTHWKVIRSSAQRTTLYLYPKTGRTHQLRVHCAHPLGLNSPMVGDDLYGQRGARLHLHAQRLGFYHPYHKTWIEFEATCPF